MHERDIQIGNALLVSLKRIDAELQRIEQLAARLSTEEVHVCVKAELISQEQHEAEMDGFKWLRLHQSEVSAIHTHIKPSEMLEIFGIMISWRKAERKQVVSELIKMGITHD